MHGARGGQFSMAQSLSRILVHVVFSTKNRRCCLTPPIRSELCPYMATVLKSMDCPSVVIGGVEDHIHILCVLCKTLSVSDLVKGVKAPTSSWLKTTGMDMGGFQWQNGYGAFSVSQSSVRRVADYIKNQERHHKRMSFQDEFRELLAKYEVEYDEQYVWD